jgi:hypothetical protein
MSRAVSNRTSPALGPSLGKRPGNLCGISDVASRTYSRLAASRRVRFGTQVLDMPLGEAVGNGDLDAPRQAERVPVASATLDAAYRHIDYHVTAWQPLGKPAFVFVIALKERRWIQPEVEEGGDFDEVMQNAVGFIERLLDVEAGEGGLGEGCCL